MAFQMNNIWVLKGCHIEISLDGVWDADEMLMGLRQGEKMQFLRCQFQEFVIGIMSLAGSTYRPMQEKWDSTLHKFYQPCFNQYYVLTKWLTQIQKALINVKIQSKER